MLGWVGIRSNLGVPKLATGKIFFKLLITQVICKYSLFFFFQPPYKKLKNCR